MKGRMESQEKKNRFINICENLDPLKLIPEKLLQSQKLIDTLKQDEIDMSMLYKCGCPDEWLDGAFRQCSSKRKKPKYSNECSNCWLQNLTEEVDIDEKDTRTIPEILKKFAEYENTGLEPDEISEILTYLGWDNIRDYQLFLDTIRDMSEFYKSKKI